MQWILGILFLSGCSLKYNAKGLLFQPSSSTDTPQDEVYLGSSEGRTWKLHLGDDGIYFPYLLGCGSEVEGVRFGKHIWVESWTITDAGDGSSPFLGTLRFELGRYLLHDLNTDTDLEILDVGWEEGTFYDLVGVPILVTGLVVGGHQVQVLSIRLLEDESDKASEIEK